MGRDAGGDDDDAVSEASTNADDCRFFEAQPNGEAPRGGEEEDADDAEDAEQRDVRFDDVIMNGLEALSEKRYGALGANAARRRFQTLLRRGFETCNVRVRAPSTAIGPRPWGHLGRGRLLRRRLLGVEPSVCPPHAHAHTVPATYARAHRCPHCTAARTGAPITRCVNLTCELGV